MMSVNESFIILLVRYTVGNHLSVFSLEKRNLIRDNIGEKAKLLIWIGKRKEKTLIFFSVVEL